MPTLSRSPSARISSIQSVLDVVLQAAVDWQAVGAVATGVAALGSLGVVVLTLSMARSAQETAKAANEEAAGAWRPVILPKGIEASYSRQHPDTVSVKVELRNAGSGPALNMTVVLSSGDHEDEFPIPTAILTPEGEATLGSLELPADTVHAELTFGYDDLGGRRHETVAGIESRPPERVADVRQWLSITYTRVRRSDPAESRRS